MPKVVPQYRKEAKGRILSAAREVFAEKGYSRATMDDVAARIGVSKGALYLYFDSKEKLFEELCRAAGRDLEEALNATFSETDVEKAADAFFDKEMRLGAGEVALWLQTLTEAKSNRVVQKLQEESHDTVIQVLTNFVGELKKRGLVRQELPSASVARVFSAFYGGVLVSVLEGASESMARETWKDGLRFLLYGLSR